MDLLAALLGGAAIAVPLALVGGLVAWVIHVQKKREQAWGRVAARMGLSHATGQIWGQLDGQSVQLRIEQRGSGKNRQSWTVAACFLQPPVDLGLAVHGQGFLSSTLGALFGAQDVPVGDPAFDAAFVVKGDEPVRVAALLREDLRRYLLRLHADRAGIHLYDAGGHLEQRGSVADERWVEWALRAVATVGRLSNEARASVPVAGPLAPHRAAWLEYARAAGLSGMDTPLCVWGRMEGASVAAYAIRSGPSQYRLEVLVRFDASLGMGLLVRPTRTLDGIASLFGGQDHALGDAAFDPQFVVKAPRADRLSQILDADVRRRILDLASRGAAVQIRDDGVTVRAAAFPSEPTDVPRLVAEAKGVARAVQLGAKRPDAGAPVPYR